MNKKITLTVLAMSLAGTSLLANNGITKQAFDAGMNSAIDVMKHERSQAGSPIEKGHCVTLKGENGEPVGDFMAIKLESLSLKMGVNPSYFRYENNSGNTENVLCFAFTKKGERGAKNILKKIREKHAGIDIYHPSVVAIGNPHSYARIIPSIGEWHEDSSSTIGLLSNKIDESRIEKKNIIKKKDKEISDLQSKIKRFERIISKSIAKLKTASENLNIEESMKPFKNTKAEKKKKLTAIVKPTKVKKRTAEAIANKALNKKIVKEESNSRIMTIEATKAK